jgi:hypothetical protein
LVAAFYKKPRADPTRGGGVPTGCPAPSIVIPAKAGIQSHTPNVDSRFLGNDRKEKRGNCDLQSSAGNDKLFPM